jgi:uncharacterized hydrophobic protein (TIGR00271 family)
VLETDSSHLRGPRAIHWLRNRPRAHLSEDDRSRAVATLYPADGDAGHWWFRFSVMMALSVVVASMGLSLNSTAVVIGAMLIAPLMTPVLAVSAALVVGWPKRLVHSIAAVVAGSAGAVGLSALLTLLLPASDRVLTNEVLSRTSPDLRDLVVAFAAGAAGAYATAREDVSAALPGVAVAVALVPPLAAIGFTIAIGRFDLAGGALLLYAANLVAIVFVGALVFLASGMVPEARRIRLRGPRAAGLFATVTAVVLIAVVLGYTSLNRVTHTQATAAVNQAVVTWLAPYPGLSASSVNIHGKEVFVDVTGAVAPPSKQSLVTAIGAELGSGVQVHVHWLRSATGT